MKFKVGDKVKANRSVQGLKAGDVYEVVEVELLEMAWGTFVTYYVNGPDARDWAIVNGHLLLSLA